MKQTYDIMVIYELAGRKKIGLDVPMPITNGGQYKRLCSFREAARCFVSADMAMGWYHPWVGLGWVRNFGL